MSSRRNFIKLAGVGALATGMPFSSNATGTSNSSAKTPELFGLGVVGFSFTDYKNDIDKTIEVVKGIRVTNVALKDFQLPYNSSQEQIDQVMGKFKAAGISVTALGVIYMRTEKEIDDAFEYTKKTGVKMIVGVPKYELLPYVEKKAKQYNIPVAIHNHGPEDLLFPDIDSTYDKIKNMDKILGICMDIGHTFRCGHDPAAMFLKYHDRIYDVHFKDVDAPTREGKAVNNGWGKIDFVAFVKALRKTKYSGMCGLENRQKDPAMALAESMGHFRGILAAV
ncbi:sugar phosphate isomerase/epimerase family protein [Flavitalea sp.]|nr:sugar phosphate isomerase/epimerase [Flavitalea sp.]